MASLVSSIDLLQQLDTQRKRLSYSIVALLWKRYTFRKTRDLFCNSKSVTWLVFERHRAQHFSEAKLAV